MLLIKDESQVPLRLAYEHWQKASKNCAQDSLETD